MAGMSFALTGKMPVKRALMECFVEYMGGTLHKRVRKDTRYLVVGESHTVSGKEDKADKWGTPTLSVDELTEKSKRLPELNDLIDEKTMRWLELSEIEG